MAQLHKMHTPSKYIMFFKIAYISATRVIPLSKTTFHPNRLKIPLLSILFLL